MTNAVELDRCTATETLGQYVQHFDGRLAEAVKIVLNDYDLLREVVKDIAKQKLGADLDEDDYLNADFAGAHDEIVKRAREALKA